MPRPRSPLVPLLACSLLAVGAITCGGDGCGGVAALPDGGEPDAATDTDAGTPSPHCELALDRFLEGTGAGRSSLKEIASESDFVGGPTAWGKPGDFLLENDKVRFVIQGHDRHIGPQPFGATIIDADLKRTGAGVDQLGEIGLLYNFGRTLDPELFEILHDGSDGRAAVLAATGHDSANDYLAIRNQLRDMLQSIPKADPYAPLPLKITNYFILPPGEQRLRFVTAFCNEGDQTVSLALGDLTDPGESVEFFNGRSCTLGFGFKGAGACAGLDPMSWYGYQGEGVAYGYAPYNPNAPGQPSQVNALLTVSGVTGSILGANGITGIASWFGDAGTPEGEVKLPAKDMRYFVRDFVVAPSLGDVASIIESSRAAITGGKTGQVSGTVRVAGTPIAGARVTFSSSAGIAAVFVTDSAGRYQGTLTARSYDAAAWAQGRLPSAVRTVTLSDAAAQTADFDLSGRRTLTVNVTQAGPGGPMPAKVTVLCKSGTCAAPNHTLNVFTDTVKDPLLGSMQLVGYVPASGTGTFEVPPGEYEVIVTRGPEFSAFPGNFSTDGGYAVDLRTSDATVSAPLFKVLDTAGHMSADFHVHAVNSPDSPVANEDRVRTFLGDGVEVIVSTDHDYVTDFAPYIQKLGAEPFLASVAGEEVSTMDFGHYNVFPLTPNPADRINGGAIDWAGGRAATLTPKMIFEAARAKGARTIHFNHPRGFLGGFTHLRVDTDTLATHADPRDFRMEPPPGSTPADTLLLSSDFNALEVLNSAEDEFNHTEIRGRLNDWFTLLSRGIKAAGTGVSDTHRKSAGAGWRTWVNTGVDTPAQFSPVVLSDALNGMKAIASNGPFVRIDARRVNAQNQATSAPVGMGGVLPPSADDVLVTVDVQVPEYLDVTRIELFTHKPQDDDSCPRDPFSPNAATTRVACNGAMNTNWPASGITAAQDVTLTGANLETVGTVGGTAYRRWHVTRTFRLPRPATDNWIIAFVYGSKSLFPLIYRPATPNKPATEITPFALTNPIFVDADGNGYDKPPFRPPPPPPRAVPPPPGERPPAESRPITGEQLERAWEVIGHNDH